jgi:hypothetical protein
MTSFRRARGAAVPGPAKSVSARVLSYMIFVWEHTSYTHGFGVRWKVRFEERRSCCWIWAGDVRMGGALFFFRAHRQLEEWNDFYYGCNIH